MGEVFLVAADQPRRLVGRETQTLPLVEKRVVERRKMFQLGQERRRQAGSGDRKVGADNAPDLLRQALVAPHRSPRRQRFGAEGNGISIYITDPEGIRWS